ncbi:MAG: hypothetical protein JJ863_26935 [Deltaproteobacteria bacterium]|nr:hypothetical protein [Deltaproteobacteria bacterium]
MDASTLAQILEAADGVTGGGSRYEVADDHRATFYLGRPGQAMEAREVSTIELGEGFVAITRREDEGTLYAPVESVAALHVRKAKTEEGRRTGF